MSDMNSVKVIATQAVTDDVGRSAINAVMWRVIPIVFVLFFFNFLDRVNIGFAALQMNQDLGFSPQVFGLGAGILYTGYILFEVPSNMILRRVGARVWLARIAVTWGALTMAMMFVNSALSLYVLRFLIGVAEAGWIPGVIFFLSQWFPRAELSKAVARMWSAVAVALILGPPSSAGILEMDGLLGLRGWQWMFLLQGFATVIAGVVAYFYLPDRPEDAPWLSSQQRQWLLATLSSERENAVQHGITSLVQALKSPIVLAFSGILFFVGCGFLGVTIWLPQMIKQMAGLSTLAIGFAAAAPFLVGAIAMQFFAQHSDRTGERRYHLVFALLVGALGLAGAGLTINPIASLAFVTVAAVGMLSAISVFWNGPNSMLADDGAAAGFAIINSLGGVAGFVAPPLIGMMRTMTGDFSGAFLILALSLTLGAMLTLLLIKTRWR